MHVYKVRRIKANFYYLFISTNAYPVVLQIKQKSVEEYKASSSSGWILFPIHFWNTSPDNCIVESV